MKCSGKVGYFLNLKKEYGDRAEVLMKKLEEGKTVQAAFINDFIKIDYINIFKVLLYMIKDKKVKTSFGGLFVDEKYANLLTYSDTSKNNNISYEIITRNNCKHNEDSDSIDFVPQLNCDDIVEYNTKDDNAKSELYEKTESNGDYKKITISKSELLNIDGIIKYDGMIENVEKLAYYLNPCSFLSAYFLDVKKNENVLDMCAAPGGKSLIIANKLFGFDISPLDRINNIKILDDKYIEINCCMNVLNYYKVNRKGCLVINEYNKGRYERLKQVLYKHLPNDLIKSGNLHITNYNGLQLNSFIRFQKFHKILLDVPCSTDEHLIKKGTNDINKWTFNSIKNNSNIQYDLLVNSFHLLHKNGVIIYSTCALSHYENDYNIEKFIKKFKKEVQILDFLEDEYERVYKEEIMHNHTIENDTHMSCHCKMGTPEPCTGHNNANVSCTDHNNANVSCTGHNNSNISCTNHNNPNISCTNHNNSNISCTNHNNPNSSCTNAKNFSEFKKNTNFLKFFEKTKYGYISLPDKSPFGILYICKIKKI
ncbi:conserved Plasmodium protein, unknown function [Plasmodium yoelii]|uniref:NOL1/NOP2/Sun domain family member 4 n=3 Tax=Plasmodium yoelii TaxID=5861 RepID=A0AAE9WNX2_PLAYO|nr:conserved Plasmodium protein, unknown function [Plasmodium yoelii]EAA21108.1 hypothetical protein [Plasmodium yoelii yoelii]WBY57528.1 hypothetical protein Py17XNL_000900399 [Plasmodium yoelii yoelii]CDU18158.1 conserved Plasmodium protein, unknown function [Plasmodium yoelii]VTZ78575.1 conserved Plasmodium protein, unknown function [Plasmodium yoelii]|eukprot:XP_729543.1 conserved Plasmodium protein, unknown function [Plasmodium yoelii]